VDKYGRQLKTANQNTNRKIEMMTQRKKIFATASSLLVSLFIALQAQAATVSRSNFTVSNLSCTSCLANIEAELKSVPGTLGMNADLRKGRVTVDHLPSLGHEQVAAIISKLGYPAAMEWTATVPEKYTNRFAANSKYRSGCSSGGCGGPSGGVTGPTAWKAPPTDGRVSRTTLRVSKLSCSSCLSNIAAELGKLTSTYGMNGYLSRGIVIVDHAAGLESSRIAAIISGLGYPAKAMETATIPAQKAYRASTSPGNRVIRTGIGCNSNGPCNASSASWQKLYNRYISKTDSK
jgi:copper chaperone CopZ